jgi:hypothetical protein
MYLIYIIYQMYLSIMQVNSVVGFPGKGEVKMKSQGFWEARVL